MITPTLAEFLPLIAPGERLLGLDMGTRKIGLALSDTLRMIATPYSTIIRMSFAKDIKALRTIITEHNVTGLIVGLPIEMDGREGDSCAMVRGFMAKFEKASPLLPIFLQDERMSTAAVTRVLNETGLTRQKKALLDDKMAASYILQGALDRIRYLASSL